VETGHDYFPSREPQLLRDFDVAVRRARPVLVQFAGQQAHAWIVQARQEYRTLIPQLPFVGTRQPFVEFIITGGWFLAVYRVLQAQGWTVEQTGQLIYRIDEAFVKAYPRFVTRFMGRRIFSPAYIEDARRRAAESQQRPYPGGWIAEFVEGDGQTFDYGVDYLECGLCKLLASQGAPELAPYLCVADVQYSEAFGWGLQRTQTLAEGHGRCDFRFKKGGKTQVAVPAALKGVADPEVTTSPPGPLS
jgi:hypothetical protein